MWHFVIVSKLFCAMSFVVKIHDFSPLNCTNAFILYNDCLLDLKKSL